MRMSANRPCMQSERDRVMRIALGGIWPLIAGQGNRTEWTHTSEIVNLTEALCHLGKLDYDLFGPFLTCAIKGMNQAKDAMRDGRPGAVPRDAAIALLVIAQAYDDAMKRFSVGTLGLALAECRERMRETTAAQAAVCVAVD